MNCVKCRWNLLFGWLQRICSKNNFYQDWLILVRQPSHSIPVFVAESFVWRWGQIQQWSKKNSFFFFSSVIAKWNHLVCILIYDIYHTSLLAKFCLLRRHINWQIPSTRCWQMISNKRHYRRNINKQSYNSRLFAFVLFSLVFLVFSTW